MGRMGDIVHRRAAHRRQGLEPERMKEKGEHLLREFGEKLGDSTKNRWAYHSRRMSLNLNRISTSNHVCAY